MEEAKKSTSVTENKPCPFCGSSELSYQISTMDREGIPANILCVDCGCAGPWLYIKPSEFEAVDELPKQALDLWNKRK